MSEGEHTIISKIPRERLNQIAARKLSALAIPVKLGADRETLEGELPLPALTHPATGQPLGRARFAVAGHDRLRFADPPLSALPAVEFYDLDRPSALEQRIGQELARRATALREQAAALRALGIEATADPARLAARAVLKTPTHAFELLGATDGLRIARVAPVGGQPYAVPASFPAVRLEDHPTRAELEIWLAQALPRLEQAARQAPRPVAGAAPALEATPPPRNALTVAQLARTFGDGGAIAPTAPIEVFQEFLHGGTHYRFVAQRDTGTLFKGRLIGPGGDVWSDRFDVADFPGIARVVSAALGLATPPPVPAAAEEGAEVPRHLAPQPGEVWVMTVVIEDQSGEDVRYVGTDIDGRPYGAARVLKRGDFEAVFSHHGGGWRLLVVIDQVQGDGVLYRQLDPRRQPIGAPRRMASAVLVANFVPEAAAY